MIKRIRYVLLPLITLGVFACGVQNRETPEDTTGSILKPMETKPLVPVIPETNEVVDLPVSEFLAEELKPVRENYKRINSIKNWTSIKQKDLSETSEGGEARFYYLNGKLEKISARYFTETTQYLTEYYLLNNKLSFVLARTYTYNRPIYYDSLAMLKNNDTEVFDFGKSEINEDRSYFLNGKLLHKLNNQDCGAPMSEDYLLKEQGSIQEEFEKLRKLGGAE